MRSDARKKLTTDQAQQPYDTSGDKWAELEGSLRWHFNCHAAEPDKSFASLGIANAIRIAERVITADLARTEAALDEAHRERDDLDRINQAIHEKNRAAIARAVDAEALAEAYMAQRVEAEARAEQAERQVREMPEQIAQAIEAEAERLRHHGLRDAAEVAFIRCARIARAALSGVSGPTPGECSKCGATTHTTGAHIAGLPADEPTAPTTGDLPDWPVTERGTGTDWPLKPTTEGASE